jgi:hypothetical protein
VRAIYTSAWMCLSLSYSGVLYIPEYVEVHDNFISIVVFLLIVEG